MHGELVFRYQVALTQMVALKESKGGEERITAFIDRRISVVP